MSQYQPSKLLVKQLRILVKTLLTFLGSEKWLTDPNLRITFVADQSQIRISLYIYFHVAVKSLLYV